MLELEREKEQQRIQMEREFADKMADALSKNTEDQALKERALRASAEQDKIRALEQAQQEREAKLKADLEAAQEAQRQAVIEMEEKL